MIIVEHYGVTGKGRTVKEAKEEAGRLLQALVKHMEHSPRVVQHPAYPGKWALLIPRVCNSQPEWTYTLHLTEDDVPNFSNSSTDFDDCKARATRHLADGVADAFGVTQRALGLDLLADPHERDNLCEHHAWQRACRAAQGKGEADVHRWACDHEREFRFDWRLLPEA